MPRLRVAAMFPLTDRKFDRVYRGPTHALHLHDYAGSIRLDDLEFELTPGTLTFSPVGGESRYDLPEPGTHWCVHFEPTVSVDGPVVQIPLVLPLGSRAPDAAARFARVARLHQLSRSPDSPPASPFAASVAMAELLHWVGLLDSTVNASTNTGHAAVERVLNHIDRNLQYTYNADTLAKTAGLSQNYLARIFHRHTGVTVARYTLNRRVELAKLLLRSTFLPIKQVAINVGLPDARHFNKQFRAGVGVSPSTYRKQGA